jgi:hypothetical protein
MEEGMLPDDPDDPLVKDSENDNAKDHGADK